MTESQEEAADRTHVPAVPGHQAGPPPKTGDDEEATRAADEVGAGHPDGIEPRAGRDK